jgi:4-aminobutyrate aminotransferase
MQATEIVKNKNSKEISPKIRDEIVDRALRKGLLLLSCGDSSIRYIPPLVVTSEQVETGMDILEEAIKEAGKN